MSEKTDRKIRKAVNKAANKASLSFLNERKQVADSLVKELFASPFKYRLRFSLALIFRRSKSDV